MLSRRNVVVVGAGQAGQLLLKDIEKNHSDLNVLGVVDDNPPAKVKTIGVLSDLSRILKTNEVDEVIIAIPSSDGEVIRNILLRNLASVVPIRIVPRETSTLLTNVVKYQNARDIQAEDFLGRAVVKKSIERLENFYKDKVVLVTGGAGSIGSEIVRQLIEVGCRRVIAYDHSEPACYELDQEFREKKMPRRRYMIRVGSVLDAKKVRSEIRRAKPDIVFHAAAYKHVHLMEDNIDEAVKTNVFGTKNVLEAAIKAGAPRFVLVSTDKAFNPKNVMGATKCLAEAVVRAQPRRPTLFSIVRFGNVINSHGSVIPLFERQISDHRYVTLTDQRMRRYFMSIREAAGLVLASATRSRGGSTYMLEMGDQISVRDVAWCLIRSRGLRPEIDVAIKVIGRRPGEKIKEQLFTKKEMDSMKKTKIPNVLRLSSNAKSVDGIDAVLDRLDKLTVPGSGKLYAYLQSLFPSLKR